MTDLVERLREKIITDAFTQGEITSGALAERLIRERLDAADEIERLRLELNMTQATIRVPSQKDDVRTIERLREELVSSLDEAARLRKALLGWQEWWEAPGEAKRPDVAELRYRAAKKALEGK